VHDFHTLRTHHDTSIVSRSTLQELQKRTEKQPIIPLSKVLDEFFGVILLNIELKGRGSGEVVAELIQKKYIKTQRDWDKVLFSSFKGGELSAVRRVSQKANLALLHSENPFMFIAYHRKLHLSAVGFHRLYINPFALEIAKRASLFTYAYTVNRPQSALLLAQQGIDGIVTNFPNTILSKIERQQA
jgi:glycerophosphoryl diester phosphodiesterase